MAMPKAYDPQDGYKHQIFCRNPAYGREWEHCDYAKDRQEKDYLISNYNQAYGIGWEFKSIVLPAKYWPKKQEGANVPKGQNKIHKQPGQIGF